ncbi:unnamed protein product [Moneuplotes crassus]|uniref:Uncharacterized protein n=1 Tax=Euplotes crassus TaxID=5936 RepID=A0AAD1XUT4_EUPCR|nr:unnamed protein product [Moneuplotes crassus]
MRCLELQLQCSKNESYEMNIEKIKGCLCKWGIVRYKKHKLFCNQHSIYLLKLFSVEAHEVLLNKFIHTLIPKYFYTIRVSKKAKRQCSRREDSGISYSLIEERDLSY